MQDLTLVGVHDDGEHLVLVGPDGHRYRVPVDEPLRAAVRRDRARLGQLQVEQSGVLRPKDIQARIRAGQTAEEVVADSGVPVENVRRYEGPVLAEREFVARQARGRPRCAAATPGCPAPTPRSTSSVTSAADRARGRPRRRRLGRLADRGGTWYIRLAFTAGGRDRHADWTYDVQLRHVTPLDDEARWLLDEQPAEGAGSRPADAGARPRRPRSRAWRPPHP